MKLVKMFFLSLLILLLSSNPMCNDTIDSMAISLLIYNSPEISMISSSHNDRFFQEEMSNDSLLSINRMGLNESMKPNMMRITILSLILLIDRQKESLISRHSRNMLSLCRISLLKFLLKCIYQLLREYLSLQITCEQKQWCLIFVMKNRGLLYLCLPQHLMWRSSLLFHIQHSWHSLLTNQSRSKMI